MLRYRRTGVPSQLQGIGYRSSLPESHQFSTFGPYQFLRIYRTFWPGPKAPCQQPGGTRLMRLLPCWVGLQTYTTQAYSFMRLARRKIWLTPLAQGQPSGQPLGFCRMVGYSHYYIVLGSHTRICIACWL